MNSNNEKKSAQPVESKYARANTSPALQVICDDARKKDVNHLHQYLLDNTAYCRDINQIFFVKHPHQHNQSTIAITAAGYLAMNGELESANYLHEVFDAKQDERDGGAVLSVAEMKRSEEGEGYTTSSIARKMRDLDMAVLHGNFAYAVKGFLECKRQHDMSQFQRAFFSKFDEDHIFGFMDYLPSDELGELLENVTGYYPEIHNKIRSIQKIMKERGLVFFSARRQLDFEDLYHQEKIDEINASLGVVISMDNPIPKDLRNMMTDYFSSPPQESKQDRRDEINLLLMKVIQPLAAINQSRHDASRLMRHYERWLPVLGEAQLELVYKGLQATNQYRINPTHDNWLKARNANDYQALYAQLNAKYCSAIFWLRVGMVFSIVTTVAAVLLTTLILVHNPFVFIALVVPAAIMFYSFYKLNHAEKFGSSDCCARLMRFTLNALDSHDHLLKKRTKRHGEFVLHAANLSDSRATACTSLFFNPLFAKPLEEKGCDPASKARPHF